MSKEKKKHESDKKDEKTSDTIQGKAPETNTVVENSTDVVQPEDVSEEVPFEKALREVDDLRKQITDANDRYIRLMAEFDNYKKRTSREYERQVDSANEKIMLEMIDVRENFERAIKSGDAGSDYGALFEGMKLIFNKFDTVLNKNGLEPYAVSGDPFDPQIHDALMNTPKAGVPAEHIADVYEKGYKLKSRVIRHAKVIVSSGEPQVSQENGTEEKSETK